MYLIYGVAGVNVAVLILLGIAALVGFTYALSGYYSRRYGIPQNLKAVSKNE
jgi:hypothetical protein